MRNLAEFLVMFVAILGVTLATELTFNLADNAKDCFFEQIDKGVKTTLEFQVIMGGNYDVDVEITAPNGQSIYKEQKKQYNSFTWTTTEAGVFKFCFSNEFSTFTHKTVYFDFQVGDEPAIIPEMAKQATAMTQMETSAVAIHEALKVINDYQTHHRLRESTGRVFAEDLNERVQLWSICESIIILIIGIGQVLVLRSFFTDKKAVISKT